MAALRGIDLTVDSGEMLAVVGPSGGGKSTLLNLIGGLDRPDSGSLEVAGTDLMASSQADLDRFRRHHVGYFGPERGPLPYMCCLLQNPKIR